MSLQTLKQSASWAPERFFVFSGSESIKSVLSFGLYNKKGNFEHSDIPFNDISISTD